MLDRVIIADTSSLIALHDIGELEILKQIYTQITIPTEVAEEFQDDVPNWIIIENVQDRDKIKLLKLELDKGESSAIALAMEQEESLLIMDEKKGRKVAKQIGLKIIGVLGIFMKAKELGLIEKVGPILDKLEEAEFWISQRLKDQILKRMNEK